MIDFIKENYTWIFSGVGATVVGLIFKFNNKREPASKYSFKKNIVKFENSNHNNIQVANKLVNNYNNFPINEKKNELLHSNLDAVEIREKIQKSAPFQRKQIALNYHGQPIKWEVTLEYINESPTKKDFIHVMTLYKGKYPWVFFTVEIDKYPILKIVEKGTILIVNGKILEVNTNGGDFEIEIDNLVTK